MYHWAFVQNVLTSMFDIPTTKLYSQFKYTQNTTPNSFVNCWRFFLSACVCMCVCASLIWAEHIIILFDQCECYLPCMINRIWGLKHHIPQVKSHAWFHSQGPAELRVTGNKRKIQNENMCICRESSPIHSTSLEMSEVSSAALLAKMNMNDFVRFHPMSPKFYLKKIY